MLWFEIRVKCLLQTCAICFDWVLLRWFSESDVSRFGTCVHYWWLAQFYIQLSYTVLRCKAFAVYLLFPFLGSFLAYVQQPQPYKLSHINALCINQSY